MFVLQQHKKTWHCTIKIKRQKKDYFVYVLLFLISLAWRNPCILWHLMSKAKVFPHSTILGLELGLGFGQVMLSCWKGRQIVYTNYVFCARLLILPKFTQVSSQSSHDKISRARRFPVFECSWLNIDVVEHYLLWNITCSTNTFNRSALVQTRKQTEKGLYNYVWNSTHIDLWGSQQCLSSYSGRKEKKILKVTCVSEKSALPNNQWAQRRSCYL